MKPQKEVKISNWAAHTTTGVSVTLALLTLGIMAIIWIAATAESHRLLEKIEISVVMTDEIGDDHARVIYDSIKKCEFALGAKYVSKDDALKNWKEATGEDLEHVFGVNPLSPEVTFSVSADHTSVKSIASIKKKLESMDGVAEVGTPDSSMVEAMNANIRKLSVGFSILAAIMLVISFVLISNTVRLSIYSRRFTIHTMQLVGATDGFIRRPFILANALVGALSGLLSAIILSLALMLSDKMGLPELSDLIIWSRMAAVDVALVAGGAFICSCAAFFATTRHLRQDYGDLFK